MPTLLDYLQIPLNHESQGASLIPLVTGNAENFTGPEYAFIDRLPWWEHVLGGWHLENQSEREAQYTPLEISKMKDYRALLNEKIGQRDYPPECIAVRTNEWKFILRDMNSLLEEISWWHFISGKKFPIEPFELYDLTRDPMEQKNVAKEHPDIVENLKTKLLEWDGFNNKKRAKPNNGKPSGVIPYP
jgi:hypothetical protein